MGGISLVGCEDNASNIDCLLESCTMLDNVTCCDKLDTCVNFSCLKTFKNDCINSPRRHQNRLKTALVGFRTIIVGSQTQDPRGII